jgi:hypothetical protein
VFANLSTLRACLNILHINIICKQL